MRLALVLIAFALCTPSSVSASQKEAIPATLRAGRREGEAMRETGASVLTQESENETPGRAAGAETTGPTTARRGGRGAQEAQIAGGCCLETTAMRAVYRSKNELARACISTYGCWQTLYDSVLDCVV